MIISVDELTLLLDHSRSRQGDTTARQALAINFVDVHGPTKRDAIYHTANGGLPVVDLDEDGRAVGVEIV